MRAVVLAGGLGTRLRPLTFAIPKPLIPVGDRPLLELVIGNLAAHGVTDVDLAVGYRAELIRLYFQDGDRFGVRIRYTEEEQRLGTAGPLRVVRERFGLDEPVLVMNADIVTELDFRGFYAGHLERPPGITVGVRDYESVVPYGVVEVEGSRITGITERPVLRFPISCGIYAVSPEVIALVPPEGPFDMPDLVAAAIAAGLGAHAHVIHEPWVAIEDLADLEENAAGPGTTPQPPAR